MDAPSSAPHETARTVMVSHKLGLSRRACTHELGVERSRRDAGSSRASGRSLLIAICSSIGRFFHIIQVRGVRQSRIRRKPGRSGAPWRAGEVRSGLGAPEGRRFEPDRHGGRGTSRRCAPAAPTACRTAAILWAARASTTAASPSRALGHGGRRRRTAGAPCRGAVLHRDGAVPGPVWSCPGRSLKGGAGEAERAPRASTRSGATPVGRLRTVAPARRRTPCVRRIAARRRRCRSRRAIRRCGRAGSRRRSGTSSACRRCRRSRASARC